MKKVTAGIATVVAMMLGLTGCSRQSVPITNGVTHSASTDVGQNQTSNNISNNDAGANTSSTMPTSSQTGQPSSGGSRPFSTDIAAVVSGIPVANAKMNPTVYAQVSGNQYGKGIEAVKFVNGSTGFLVGDGIILKTTDGGQRFQTALQSHVDFTGVTSANGSQSTVAAWGENSIAISQDEGSSWKTVQIQGANGPVQTVDFVNASEGFVIIGLSRDARVLWRTTDGGVHWQKMSTPNPAVSVSFGSNLVGWMGTTSGDIYETKDAGDSWVRVFHPTVQTPGTPELQAVSSLSCWALMIGGSGMSQTSYAVFRTEDGSTWKAVMGVSTAGAGPAPDGAQNATKGPDLAPGPMVALNPKQAAVTGVCRACGMGAAQLATTGNGGASWTTHPTIQNGLGEPLDMSFVTLTDGWILDRTYMGGSVLLHTTDAGQTWTEVYPMVHPHPVQGISFLSANIGYGLGVPGDANAILKTADGGHSWQQVGTLPTQSQQRVPMNTLYSPIDFVSASHGYAIGADGNVYVTTDGGVSWKLAVSSGNAPFVSVHFVDHGQYGIASTASNEATVTGDGGLSWHHVALSLSATVGANAELYLAGLAKLPAAGGLKNWLHQQSPQWMGIHGDSLAWLPSTTADSYIMTTNGGASWTTVSFGTDGPDFLDMDFVNSQDGWMISIAGELLRTMDGGKTWVHASHPNG